MFASRHSSAGGAHVIDAVFTDREGGVTTGEHASLDLTSGRPGADAALAENRRRLAEALAVSEFAFMRQVHGDTTVPVDAPCGPDSAPAPVCDAIVTRRPGLALVVRAADCVPVLLADPTAGVVGAAHAGRPGVVAGIVASVVTAMRELGSHDITAWLGPHVCGACYEVPPDMRRAVSAVEPSAYGWTTWGTPSVDIGAAVRAQLIRLGCRVDDEPVACTREREDLFSYRRQGAASGRAAGVIVLRAVT